MNTTFNSTGFVSSFRRNFNFSLKISRFRFICQIICLPVYNEFFVKNIFNIFCSFAWELDWWYRLFSCTAGPRNKSIPCLRKYRSLKYHFKHRKCLCRLIPKRKLIIRTQEEKSKRCDSSYMYRIDNEIHFKNFINCSLSVVTFKSKCFRSLRKNFLSKCFMLRMLRIWLRESIQFWLLHSHLLTYFFPCLMFPYITNAFHTVFTYRNTSPPPPPPNI